MDYTHYIPDSIHARCDNKCNICSSNIEYSKRLKLEIQQTKRGKVFCPFGKKENIDLDIYFNQIHKNTDTTWGRVPQLDPRSLSRIGLEWRN